MFKKIILFICGFICFVSANNLHMRQGESRIFNTKDEINTVFASDPKILDYKVIDQHNIAIYSINDGYGEIKVFGSKNNIILDIKVDIDAESKNLQRIAEIIQRQNPGSLIRLEKLNPTNNSGASLKKGYIISGNVPNEQARENAYEIAATALGLVLKSDKVRRQSAIVTSSRGTNLGSSSSGGTENLSFLEKKTAEGLVDDLVVTSPKQLNVKLIVADVEKEMIDKIGISFNESNIFKFPVIKSPFASYKNGLKLGFKELNVLATIEAMESDRLAKILATPNISVLSGESASVQVTSQFTPISTTVANTGNAVSSTGTPVDYGVSLTIQPKIFSKDKIVLNISQEVSSIQDRFEKSGASGANLKKRRTQSVFELADGDTFVIGGLVDQRDIEHITGIPGLKDIPLIGAAFKHNSIARTKTELIVIATVNIVSANSQNKDIKIPSFKVKSLSEYAFNFNGFKVSSQQKQEVEDFMLNLGFIK